MASKDFNKAFAAARKELGAGKTFTWQGKSYSTNVAGEGKTPKAKGFSVDMAKSAIDKAVGVQTPTSKTPRPKARPVDKTPTPVAAPAKITTSKLSTVSKSVVPTRQSVIENKAKVAAAKARNAEQDAKKAFGPGGNLSTVKLWMKKK